MSLYCSSCRGPFDSLIELRPVYSKLFSTVYQCPCCTRQREVDFRGIATATSTTIVPQGNSTDEPKRSSALRKVGKLTIAAAIIAIIANSGSR